MEGNMLASSQQVPAARVAPAAIYNTEVEVNEPKPIQVGELATLIVAVCGRRGDRLLCGFDRDGKYVKKWFREGELTGLGFDDGYEDDE